MKYIYWPEIDARHNLAAEEYVFTTLDRSEEFFLLWQNENAIIIGKNQNTLEEINTDYVREHGVQVVRRITGGGAVYHDLGNLNYSFIMNTGTYRLAFKELSQPIVTALQKLNVDVQFSGRNDLLIDGKKVSGSAQYIKSGRMLHHGTLLFNANLDLLGKVLSVKDDKIQSKAIKSVRSRVTNISDYLPGMDITQFRKVLEQSILEDGNMTRYEFSEHDKASIRTLQGDKYDTWEWNYGRSPEFDIKKERRFSDGGVSIYMKVSGGVIQDIHIRGDFFGNRDISGIESRLQSVRLEMESIRKALIGIEVGEYIHGMGEEALADIIVH